MTSETFSYDHAFAAMCLWEEIAEPSTLLDAGTPWQEMREQIGSNELRSQVLLKLAAACDAAWSRANALSSIAYSSWQTRKQEHEVKGEPFYDEPPTEPGSFDYEFVPFWIRNCVDWTDPQSGPRVKGDSP